MRPKVLRGLWFSDHSDVASAGIFRLLVNFSKSPLNIPDLRSLDFVIKLYEAFQDQ